MGKRQRARDRASGRPRDKASRGDLEWRHRFGVGGVVPHSLTLGLHMIRPNPFIDQSAEDDTLSQLRQLIEHEDEDDDESLTIYEDAWLSNRRQTKSIQLKRWWGTDDPSAILDQLIAAGIVTFENGEGQLHEVDWSTFADDPQIAEEMTAANHAFVADYLLDAEALYPRDTITIRELAHRYELPQSRVTACASTWVSEHRFVDDFIAAERSADLSVIVLNGEAIANEMRAALNRRIGHPSADPEFAELTSHAEWQQSLERAQQYGLIEADQVRIARLITDASLDDIEAAAEGVGVALEQLRAAVDRLVEVGLMLSHDNPAWGL